MRKKTLIVIDNLHTGGVATSLYNYLLYTKKYLDCDLLVFNEESIDYSKLPSGVRVLKPQRVLHILGKNSKELTKESVFLNIFRNFLFVLSRLINGVIARKIFLFPFVEKIGKYEFALAYAQDDSWNSLSKGCIDFVIEKVEAKHKSVMVHCDYGEFGGYNKNQTKQFCPLDSIICVSKSCRESFINCFPSFREKVFACENFTNTEYIIKSLDNVIHYPTEKINFVSVCRISEVKGLDRALEAFRNAHNRGYSNFTWTIVGDGPQKSLIEKMIAEYDLSDFILLVGNQDPPYNYIKNASYFLLPSRHEAAPMVFGECAVLSVPIITTRTCSADELVSSKNLGFVVENSKEGIENIIVSILTNQTNWSETSSGIDINKNARKQFIDFLKFV